MRMASSVSTIELTDPSWKAVILGVHGATIRGLTERFRVRIVFSSDDPVVVSIAGVNHQEAWQAINSLLDDYTHRHQVNPKQTTEAMMDVSDKHNELRTVSCKLSTNDYFMKYQLRTKLSQFDEKTVKLWITTQLVSLAGQIGGGSVDVDVLVVNMAQKCFLIRVPYESVSTVQSAISMGTQFGDYPCTPLFLSGSSQLITMAAPQRLLSSSNFSIDS